MRRKNITQKQHEVKTYRYRYWVASWLVSVVVCQQVSAFDVGNPWFPEPGGKVFQVEDVFEHYRREIDFERDIGVLSNPEVGDYGAYPGLSGEGAIEGNSVMVRFAFFPVGPVALQMDVGTNGKSSGGDHTLFFGGSGRILLYNDGDYQISTQIGVHIAPDFDTKRTGISTVNGPFEVQGEYGFTELSWSIIGSRRFRFGQNQKLIAYGGPRLNTYKGEFSHRVYFSDIETTLRYKGEEEQQSVFGLVLGGVYEFNQVFSIRTEARLVNETSLSGALTWSY